MRVQELYGRHKGQPIWVVGTGPSMQMFPKQLLPDHITIGLNQAWRYGPLTYSLTVHPEHVLEWEKEKGHPTQWITKKKGPLADLSLDDPRYYVFHTEQENYDLVRAPKPDVLFLAHGIHNTAMVLAAHMGASVVYLVGCDMGELGGDHHGHDQHVRFHGLPPSLVYKEYRRDAAKVRRILRDELNVPVLTISPFLGLTAPEEDYHRLRLELNLAKLPPPKDTSPYKRKKPKL